MNVPAEWLFALLLLGFYVHDALALVPANEAWLEHGARRWHATFPTREFTWARKHVLVPSLIAPWTPAFRLQWSLGEPAAVKPWEARPVPLRYALLSAVAFEVAVILLPLALMLHAAESALLLLIGAAYATVLAAIATLMLDRKLEGVPRGARVRLCAEMLLCPPVAANLARRLSLMQEVPEDFIAACRRLLPPAQWEAAREELRLRLQAEIDIAAEDSHEHAALVRRKEALE